MIRKRSIIASVLTAVIIISGMTACTDDGKAEIPNNGSVVTDSTQNSETQNTEIIETADITDTNASVTDENLIVQNAEPTYFTNPVIWADVPDPSVIRVGDAYYMTSTTMHYAPGCPVMKSYDLVNWEIVNYVYDILEDDDTSSLRNEADAYSKGSWASSLRYNDGTFYVVFTAYNTGKTYIFQTEDIENGPWRKYSIDGVYHDMSLLFDDDGRVYMVYGGGIIKLIELTSDATAIKAGGLKKDIIDTTELAGEKPILNAEGAHIYKIDGKYYVFLITWTSTGSSRRIELCYRADEIDGEYEGRVVHDNNIGYKNSGVAQGGVVQALDGSWYGILFQDHGAVGRVPVLLPVTWEDGWPVFDPEGIAAGEMFVPVASSDLINDKKSIVSSDEFEQGSVVKDFSASNVNVYNYEDPNEIYTFAESDIIINGNFNDSDNSWFSGDSSSIISANESLLTAETESSDYEFSQDYINTAMDESLLITEKDFFDYGLSQDITNKIARGNTYEVSASVQYLEGADTREFNIFLRHGNDGAEFLVASGTVNKGEWGTVTRTFVMPRDINISKNIISLKAVWAEGETECKYYIDSFSMINKGKILEKSQPGEYDYNGSNLNLVWQWNHNPDNNNWSLTENPGYLRITNGRTSKEITRTRNMLTQRTYGPECSGEIAIETSGMKNGDTAGLAAYQYNYGYVGVKMIENEKYIVMVNRSDENAVLEESIPLNQDKVYLKVHFDFNENADKAYFYYSLDGKEWTAIGKTLRMTYSLNHFTGYRFGLFNFAEEETGGYVDFDYFRLGENNN